MKKTARNATVDLIAPMLTLIRAAVSAILVPLDQDVRLFVWKDAMYVKVTTITSACSVPMAISLMTIPSDDVFHAKASGHITQQPPVRTADQSQSLAHAHAKSTNGMTWTHLNVKNVS